MTETYSLSITGARADQTAQAKVIKVGDTAGPTVGQNYVMSDGTNILCKNPDGSLQYYRIDNERSTPGNLILLPV